MKSGELRGPNTPNIEGWPEKGTTDPTQIRRWSRKWPGFVSGIVTGRDSGIAVLNLDRKNGKDGFAELHRMGLDPDTIWVASRFVTTF